MPEFGLAGAETMCENLTYELVNKGNEVIVVSLYNFHSPITERIENSNIPLLYLNKKPGLDISIIKKIRNIIKQYRPDIVHTHRYLLKYVAIAVVGLNIKSIVHTVHNIAQKENNLVDRYINKIIFKCKQAVPVALSKEIQSTISEVYNFPVNELPVVFNGFSIKDVSPKIEYSFKDKIRIINVGRYTSVKNQLSLIEAVNKLHKENSEIELNIYGDGPLKAELNQKIKELKAENYIHENGLTDKVTEKLRESDIFILPSVYEGMPMTIIEAMSLGLPIIASNVGGIPDMIEDGRNGLLCNTNVESIYSSLKLLIENEQLRETLGRGALIQAEVFSAEQMAKSYVELYNRLINN
ncbi:MAG: glycosyltransferase family 4 protein [Duncaniella sp.]|uniref:glycosyltransferase family 4 protein n=1 Tax=Duncaniella sp. TaxID=2518496 RepID=UPI0023C52A2F|nr:glycosyltransferase family 4 protein [Duncaniella sp.]MDE6091303.1 glycosyltransferase family 4 protein [Duncaniella sp.]